MKRTRRKSREYKIRNIVLEYVDSNLKTYLILLIIFLIGIIFGVIFVNSAKENQSNQMQNYIQNFINSIKENYQISQTKLLANAVAKSTITASILWFLGLTVIGMPLIYLFILYKGFCLGFTSAAIVGTLGSAKGALFIISTMLLQNIIYIPIMITLAVNGIKLYSQIMEDRRKDNIKLQILRHTIFSILMLAILVIAAFIETYISGNLSNFFVKFY